MLYKNKNKTQAHFGHVKKEIHENMVGQFKQGCWLMIVPYCNWIVKKEHWLVVSTRLKNISQNGNLPQIGMNIKNIWNLHLEQNFY